MSLLVRCCPQLVIHKNDWERIKKQSKSADEVVPVDPREEYFAELTKLSQKWIRKWPNSLEGAADRLEQKKNEKKKKELALVKQYAKKLMRGSSWSEEMTKARQIIFERSSYGRQLWGALIESQVLEEREAQIKFNNELKKKQAELDKTQELLNTLPTINTDEDEKQKQKRLINTEYVKMNKELDRIKKANDAKRKEEDTLCDTIDEAFIKPIIEKEKEKELTLKRLQKEEVVKYAAEKKEIAKIKAIRKEIDEALTEKKRKEKDILQCKINATHKKIIDDILNSTKSKQTYEIIEKHQKDKLKQYDEFIEKGIKRYEEKRKADELKQIEKEKLKKSLQIKQPTEMYTYPISKKKSYCKSSDRCSLYWKPEASKRKGKLESEYNFTEPPLTMAAPLSLKDKLRQREKEKSPFTGTGDAHAQFAQQAAIVLQDCKYKHLPRKVIDNYRKINRLDAASLPVLNCDDS